MHRTRRHQINQSIYPSLLRKMRQHGEVGPESGALIKDALQTAAMIGAVAERDRTLRLIEGAPKEDAKTVLYRAIIRMGVLEVLGYPQEKGKAK